MMIRKPMLPSAPATVVNKTVKYPVEHEHILRRLSSGMLIHWDSLPNDLQDLIIDQAVVVEDRHPETPSILDVENFIRTVKVAKLLPVKVTSNASDDAAVTPIDDEGSRAFSFSK